MKPFEPGEVAVLLNKTGGRLFFVHRMNGQGRVVERSSRENQQPYAFDVHPGQLVKVPSIDAADRLIATLGRIHADFEQRVWKLNAERSREMAAAIKPYVDITPPATPVICATCLKPINFDVVLGSRCECAKKVRMKPDDWIHPDEAIKRLTKVGLSAFVDYPKLRYTNGTASRSGSLTIHPNGCVDGVAVGRIINREP